MESKFRMSYDLILQELFVRQELKLSWDPLVYSFEYIRNVENKLMFSVGSQTLFIPVHEKFSHELLDFTSKYTYIVCICLLPYL